MSEAKMSGGLWTRLRQFFFNLGLFIRFSVIGGSLIIALLGAATVMPDLTAVPILKLIIGVIAFHNYAYILNDVIDLPIDRTEPRRAQFPLVQGLIRPKTALILALLHIPIAFWITADFQPPVIAHFVLAATFLLMTIYNIWGKNIAFPPLTDIAQGVAWGGLGVWGALVVAGRVSTLTMVVFLFIMIYIMLINGVHGSLRDLPNDGLHGVRSTAVLFGTRVQTEQGLFVPGSLKSYAAVWQTFLFAILFWTLWQNPFHYDSLTWSVTAIGITALSIFSWYWLWQALNLAENRAMMLAYGTLHLLASFGSLLALFFLYVSEWLQIMITLFFIGPLSTHMWVRNAIRWFWQKLPTSGEPDFPTPQPSSPPPSATK